MITIAYGFSAMLLLVLGLVMLVLSFHVTSNNRIAGALCAVLVFAMGASAIFGSWTLLRIGFGGSQ